MDQSSSLTERIERIDPHRSLVKPGEEDLMVETSENARRFFADVLPMLARYHAAMREMEVRFEIIDRDLSVRRHRNPIHHVESRVKDPRGVYEKLARYGKPQTVANAERYVMDIAGVRVICSYIHDVYELCEMLKRHDDLEVVNIKDYVANPKPNGYRSLHMIVKIPVHFVDRTDMIPVEVQIRTIAMDFWASLEHELKYKAVSEVAGIDSYDELRDCSRIIRNVESRMRILAQALDAE
ncbi:MAG: (p)ppGpp synthetase [Berryella intestinalis]|uniref:(P)ppGpp synthetase n=1 Tax=Berryella intestinalis TaxID=1531429 RepID=A0A0A8BB91_9ACTN|nr:(p)ppGpp synthetase [Berryella intestinalis]AJC12447.1 (p)ppGpp synthetase [Berryella intestinalis]MDY3128914.1 (p)ppGpp synthetase [Berryella intestinalis]